MEIKVRNIKEEDIEEVVAIQMDGWKTAYRGIIDSKYLDSMDKESKIEKRKNDYNKNGFIVATIDDEIVGFCRYCDSNEFSPEHLDIDCELCALYVKPNLKRNGIGRVLFSYVLQELKNKGRKKMILWCLKENYPSRSFYEKMGGKIYCYQSKEIAGKEYEEVSYIYDI